MSAPRIAIIAAMPGEIRPLVRGWERSVFNAAGRRFRMFQRGRAFALAGGMGEPARVAAHGLIEFVHPDVVISLGWAGSLRPELKLNEVVIPEVVIDAADGRAFRTFCGTGTLVTAAEVADPEDKSAIAARFSAQAIDMEAAGVAQVAQESTTHFLAVKAIFDEYEFAMPPVGRFRDNRGSFRYGRFLAYLALRPGLWPKIRKMQLNARSSAESLSKSMQKLLASDSLVELQQQVAQHALGIPL